MRPTRTSWDRGATGGPREPTQTAWGTTGETVKETKLGPVCTKAKPNEALPEGGGHSYASYTPGRGSEPGYLTKGVEGLNRCIWCGRISEHQPNDAMEVLAAAKRAAMKVAVMIGFAVVMSFLGLGAFFAAAFSVRDKEINFLMLNATLVATGVTGESSVDLDTIGINFANRMGMRIFKVEVSLGVASEVWAVESADRNLEFGLRTITSGGVIPFLTDDGVITYGRYNHRFITGAGEYEMNTGPVLNGAVFPEGLLIASDRIYSFINNASGGNISLRWRIWYKLEKLSESDYRELWEIWRRA